MSVARDQLARADAAALEFKSLNGSDEQYSALNQIDRLALGTSREKHHRLLATEPGIIAVGLYASGAASAQDKPAKEQIVGTN